MNYKAAWEDLRGTIEVMREHQEYESEENQKGGFPGQLPKIYISTLNKMLDDLERDYK